MMMTMAVTQILSVQDRGIAVRVNTAMAVHVQLVRTRKQNQPLDVLICPDLTNAVHKNIRKDKSVHIIS